MRRVDDLGWPVDLPRPARRIVSLVPSLTEAVAVSHREWLVGATQWCTRPADLDVVRVRGTKNPDVAAIIALRPDVVLANKEENRELDVRCLREAGIAVWVTVIESVPQALTSLERLFTEVLNVPEPHWVSEAKRLWSDPLPPVRARVVVAVWRNPWMVVGHGTYAGDLLRRVGLDNVFADHSQRYPQVGLEEMDRADVDLVLLPDEPYAFTAEDGPEAFRRARTQLFSGRLLTWYGPAMVEAPHVLRGPPFS